MSETDDNQYRKKLRDDALERLQKEEAEAGVEHVRPTGGGPPLSMLTPELQKRTAAEKARGEAVLVERSGMLLYGTPPMWQNERKDDDPEAPAPRPPAPVYGGPPPRLKGLFGRKGNKT